MKNGVTMLVTLALGAVFLAPASASAQKSGGSTDGPGAEWHCFTCANFQCPQSEEMSYYVKDDTPPYGEYGSTYGGASFCQMGGCGLPGRIANGRARAHAASRSHRSRRAGNA